MIDFKELSSKAWEALKGKKNDGSGPSVITQPFNSTDVSTRPIDHAQPEVSEPTPSTTEKPTV